jgi:hypothetical protein
LKMPSISKRSRGPQLYPRKNPLHQRHTISVCQSSRYQ